MLSVSSRAQDTEAGMSGRFRPAHKGWKAPSWNVTTTLNANQAFHCLFPPLSCRWEGRRGEGYGSPGHTNSCTLHPLLRGLLQCDLPPEVQTHPLKVSSLLSCEDTTGTSKELAKQLNHILEASFHTQLNLLTFSLLPKDLCEQRLPLMEGGGS